MLVGKLLLVVAIHSLGGSRTNWHHTPNPQLGAAQPTQDGDHTSHEQSTRVAFGAPLSMKSSRQLKGPNGYRGVNSLLKISTTTLSKPVRQI